MSPSNLKPQSKKILVGLTGSIACFKTAAVISALVKTGHEVQVIATPSALKFIGEATLEGLTGKPVLSDTFASGHMMDHIHLARWADAFVVAPMTALHLNKFALGLADDFLTTLYLAYEKHKPLYLAPAMNVVMYGHETVQESLGKLKTRGAFVFEPGEGLLACGETGQGRMAEPEEILARLNLDFSGVNPALAAPSLAEQQRVLVSFGGTREPIDGVRAITNLSTGETGALLVDALAARGFAVTALKALTAPTPSRAVHVDTFETHQDLNERMAMQLSGTRFTAVIHLAAVSDYRVQQVIADGKALTPSREIKLGSDKSLTLQLEPTSKIVNRLKSYAQSDAPLVVAFKLTNTRDHIERDRAIQNLLHSHGVDWVVHNDLHEIDKAAGRHRFQIYSADNTVAPVTVPNVEALAASLAEIITKAGRGLNADNKNFRTSSAPAEFRLEVNRDLMS